MGESVLVGLDGGGHHQLVGHLLLLHGLDTNAGDFQFLVRQLDGLAFRVSGLGTLLVMLVALGRRRLIGGLGGCALVRRG